MDAELSRLYEAFRGIRTLCTGIMGYLAMLHEGDFKGEELKIVGDLQKAASSAVKKVDDLRDDATHVTHGRLAELDDAASIIVAGTSQIRMTLKALSSRLASSVPGLPASHWADALQSAQFVIREIAAMNDALKAAHAAAGTVKL